MEVKDVRNTKLVNGAKALQAATVQSTQQANQQEVSKKDLDAVQTQINTKNKSLVRIQLNDVINISNVAKDATTQISKIVQSISGIIKQASKEDLPEQRRTTLEKEANELIGEIRKTADSQATNGVKPLAGDKIRLEVEEKLGKTLDVILPDDAKNAFGLTEIDFSTKDSIIATIANVKKAEESINNLRTAVEQASKSIEDTAGTIDVAMQNSEASENSIRDLDLALKVAGLAKNVISQDPEKAIRSLGKLGSNSLDLLD